MGVYEYRFSVSILKFSMFLFLGYVVAGYGELVLPDPGNDQPVGVATHSSGPDEVVPPKDEPLKLQFELSDGTRLIGIPKIETLPFKTSFADMKISLKLVDSIEFSKESGSAKVLFRNGDKLEGSLEVKEIAVETLFGKHSIPMKHVVSIGVAAGGVGDAVIPKEGLVLYYSFDKDENGVVKDKSGSGNDGKVNGAKWVSKGKVRGAYTFSGVNEFISVKNSETLTSGDLTVSAWISPEAVSSEMGMIAEKRPHDGCWELLCLGSQGAEGAKILLRGGARQVL